MAGQTEAASARPNAGGSHNLSSAVGSTGLPAGRRGIEGLGVEEVCAWLAEMELGEYGERFRENKIDGDLLVDLRCRR